MFSSTPPLVLASGSRYRRELLGRLGVAFAVDPADVPEEPLAGEPPAQTAERLALVKARSVALRHPAALVIGADQVADLDGEAISKPGDHARACEQLRRMSGRAITFHTATCLLAPGQAPQSVLVDTIVQYRTLDEAAIERYLRRDQPYDCAGSARIEQLGVTLVESVRSDDPTALIGLPLIALGRMLRAAGFELP